MRARPIQNNRALTDSGAVYPVEPSPLGPDSVFVRDAEEFWVEGLRARNDAGDIRIFFIGQALSARGAFFLTDLALLSLDLLLLLASSFSIALGKCRSCLQVGISSAPSDSF